MRYALIVFCFVFFVPAFAQQDSLSVYVFISKSQNTVEKEGALKFANKAYEISKKFGLTTQVDAGQNLFRTQLKFNEKYNGLRTYFELNTLLNQRERWEDLIANYQIIGQYYKSQKLYSNAIQQLEKVDLLAIEKSIDIDFWQNTIIQR